MATSPLITQGTLNRLRGSVIIPSLPNLNVTNGYLGKLGIRLAIQGDATQFIDTMTGMVTSPEPYLPAVITLHLLRTQGLAALWRSQWETQITTLGQVTVVPDTSTWPDFDFQNCGITSVGGDTPFDGTDPGIAVVIRGTYQINASMFNLT
jgi:hypothetical protein